ncbi:MAG: oligosaccharide flippase family protein [Smithella sp.]|nr:oligosaccharide flippase family protein [Smithella sp.]
MQERRPLLDGRGVALIARNLTYLLGGQGVYFVTRFVYAIVLARFFGPQIYGMINYGIAWYLLFIPLTRWGMDTVLSRDVGKNRTLGEDTANLTLTLRIISIVIVTAVYLVASVVFETDPQSRLMVLVFSFALIGRSLAWWTGSVYIAYECTEHALRQQTIFRSLEVLLGLLAIFIWKEALLVVLIHGLIWCLEAVYGLAVIRRRVFTIRLRFDVAALANLFTQVLPLGVAMLLMNLTSQGPLIYFRHVVSSGDLLGQLALAMQAFFILSTIPLTLGNAALPILSRSADREDGKDKIYAETMIRYALLSGCVVALLGTAFGPWLILKIFGHRYAATGALIGPVLWLVIPLAVRQSLSGVLIARKKDLRMLWGTLIGALLFVVTIQKAVEHFGALGAILSAIAAMTLTTAYFMFVLRQWIRIDLRFALLKPGLAVSTAVATFYALFFAGPVIAVAGAFAILFLMCYWLKCITSQDVVWLKNALVWIKGKVSLNK